MAAAVHTPFQRSGIVFTRPNRDDIFRETAFESQCLDELDDEINTELMAVRIGAKYTYGKSNTESAAKHKLAALVQSEGQGGPLKCAAGQVAAPCDDDQIDEMWTNQVKLMKANTPRGGGLIFHKGFDVSKIPASPPKHAPPAVTAPRPKKGAPPMDRKAVEDTDAIMPMPGAAASQHFKSASALLFAAQSQGTQCLEGLQLLKRTVIKETAECQKVSSPRLHNLHSAAPGSPRLAALAQMAPSY